MLFVEYMVGETTSFEEEAWQASNSDNICAAGPESQSRAVPPHDTDASDTDLRAARRTDRRYHASVTVTEMDSQLAPAA